MLRRRLDHHAKIAVLLREESDIAGIDPVFGERFSASRILAQEEMAIVVKVADDRDVCTDLGNPVPDVRNCCCRFGAINSNPHQLRARIRELGHLARRRLDLSGIGIGHRLDYDRCAATDGDLADLYANRFSPLFRDRKAHFPDSFGRLSGPMGRERQAKADGG